jgi:hypothetical protein
LAVRCVVYKFCNARKTPSYYLVGLTNPLAAMVLFSPCAAMMVRLDIPFLLPFHINDQISGND